MNYIACQAPLSMGFPSQEYWSLLPFPPPGDLCDLEITPESLKSAALVSGFFILLLAPPGKPLYEPLSRVWLFATPWTTHTRLPCPSLPPGVCSNLCPLSWWCHPTLILCCPLLLLPSIFSSIKVFYNESALYIRCPKYWSFSFSISPSNESSELISFRTDWFDLLAVQGTLKSLLQYHNYLVKGLSIII